MTEPSGSPPPGWYYAIGDPMGTQRYWDGAQWVGDPMWAPQPPPAYGAPSYPTRDFVPGINRTLADPGRRIVARIIDGLIVGIVVGVPLVIWLVRRDSFDSDQIEDVGVLPSLLFAVPALLYEVVFVALKGATPGKMAMGIAVIRQDGTSPPGWGASCLRYVLNLVGLIPVLGGLASIVLLLISFVFLFTDERRRTIPDRIATTYVVDTPRSVVINASFWRGKPWPPPRLAPPENVTDRRGCGRSARAARR